MMRRVFAFILVLVVLFTFEGELKASVRRSGSSETGGDDLGVQAVGGGAQPKPVEPIRFDDVTFNKAYKIDGYATVTLLGFKFVNMFAQWEDGRVEKAKRVPTENNVLCEKPKTNRAMGWWNDRCNFRGSGNEAEFAWLKADVQNLQKIGANFMNDISIKVIYDDEYEYNGWVRQFNYDYSKTEIYRYKDTTPIGWPVCLSPADEMPIDPMYKGHYAFGCTLPNFIVEDRKSPLRMVIKLGENELTYNIRK